MVYNYGYKNYKKFIGNKQVTSTYEDIFHANIHIFKHAAQYNRILILEDDFIFSPRVKNTRIVDDIQTFLTKMQPQCYFLGSIPILVNPLDIICAKKHIQLYIKGQCHSVIYSKMARDLIISNIQDDAKQLLLRYDIDDVTNLCIKNKYGYYYSLCNQELVPTSNMESWIHMRPMLLQWIMSLGTKFVVQFNLVCDQHIHKKYDVLYTCFYGIHMVAILIVVLIIKIICRQLLKTLGYNTY